MEMTVREVAEMTGVTSQRVNAALREGTLSGHRVIGPTVVIDDQALTAWNRSRGRGRRWDPPTREAAIDLASTGSTEHLSGSVLSRLRGVLRSISALRFAHLAGGLGGRFARYTLLEDAPQLEDVGPSAIDRELLGIGTGQRRFVRVDDLDQFEWSVLARLDADGSLGVVERPPDQRLARTLLDTYLLGTSRESHAAATLLEEACHAI